MFSANSPPSTAWLVCREASGMVRLTSSNLADEESDEDVCTPGCFHVAGWVEPRVRARQGSAESLPLDSGSPMSTDARRPSRSRRASSPVNHTFKAKKKQLDVIYTIHACSALGVGAVALIHPDIFEIFMNLEHVTMGCRRISEQANTIIRLYGALILSQAWLVWKTREVEDPFVRKMFAQGYCLCFSLSTLVLGYKQLFSTEWGALNWPVILFFFAFSGVYAWFLITKKLPEYDRPGNAAV